MTTTEILRQLQSMGNEQTQKVHLMHGAQEPIYGVRVQDLKKIQKQLKNEPEKHSLALELFDTGNSDARYLAGLLAEPKEMEKQHLQAWAEAANWYLLSEYTVAWVTAESRYGMDLGLSWIESPAENLATAGWATLSYITSLKADAELDLALYRKLLQRVEQKVHVAPNRVRYTMNGFVIAVGCNVVTLASEALAVAEKMGAVQVEMGGTACKVPLASEYILKVQQRGLQGKKRKSVRC